MNEISFACTKHPIIKSLLISALAGATLGTSFPLYGLWPNVWFGFALFYSALDFEKNEKNFLYGLVAGFVMFAVSISWIGRTMTDFGGMSIPAMVMASTLLYFILGLYFALFAYITGLIAKKSGRAFALSIAPFVWVSLEFIRGNLPHIGFPWARIADSQFEQSQLIQIADIAGEEGIGYLIVFFNSALFLLIRHFYCRNEKRGDFHIYPVITAMALLAGTFIYGQYSLEKFSADNANKKIKVALIQGNVEQSRKWNRSYRDEQVSRYESMSRDGADKGAQILVWPETAAPFYFGRDPVYDFRILELSAQIGKPIIFGSPAFDEVDGERIYRNRAWAVTPDGETAKYDKMHLVPFGEYIPFRSIFFFVDKMAKGVGRMEPGSKREFFDLAGTYYGMQICFEIIFPSASREIALSGADAIVNITNDSWFGKTALSTQHLSMAVFRAVENRMPVLRSAQSGISAIIEPAGTITSQSRLFETVTITGEALIFQNGPTWYAKLGNMFSYICFMLTFLGLVINRK